MKMTPGVPVRLGLAALAGLMLAGCGRLQTASVAPGTHSVKVTVDTFQQEVLESPIPVIVDFWASWCGPCLRIAPTLEILGQEFDGRIKVCKVNVDENQELAATYEIRSIPALLAFKDGKLVDQQVGAANEDEFRAWFTSLL